MKEFILTLVAIILIAGFLSLLIVKACADEADRRATKAQLASECMSNCNGTAHIAYQSMSCFCNIEVQAEAE